MGKRIDCFIKSAKPIEDWLIQGPANGAERDYDTGQPQGLCRSSKCLPLNRAA